MITYNVQFAQFDPDHVEERGSVTEREALQALSDFPFDAELEKLKQLPEGCAPTITFRDSENDSHYAVWKDESQKFTVDGKLGNHSFCLQEFTDSKDLLVQGLRNFINQDWESLKVTLAYKEPFFAFSPKFVVVSVIEAFIVVASIATANMHPAIARFILDDPTPFLRFLGQFILINVLVGTALFYPSKRRNK